MAGPLFYIPGVRHADAGTFEALGLGELARDGGPACVEVPKGSGPDDRGGCLAFFPNPTNPASNPEPRYNPDGQVWQKAKPNERLDLAAGRFWLGMECSRPPEPRDLARPRMIRGRSIVLGDGNLWHVPVSRFFPQALGLDAEGAFAKQPLPEYARQWEASKKVFEWLVPKEGEPGVPEAEGWEACVTFLAVNYRVNRDVCDWLGLFDSVTLVEVCKVVVEFDDLLELMRQRLEKKTEQPTETLVG